MTVTAKPIVLSDDGTKHVALSEGSYIDNASIDKESLVSKDTDNILKTGSDGQLLVAKSDLPASVASDFISKDTDNQVTLGSDDKLYVANKPIQDLVSADDNVISVNPIDNKLQVDPEEIKTIANKEAESVATNLVDTVKTELSSSIDKNTADINDLKTDLDAVTIVSGDANNLLVRGSDNGAKVTSSDLLSNGSAENLIKVNAVDQRLEVAKSDVQDVAKAVIADTAIVSNDAGNLLIKGSDKGAYLAASALPTQVSAGSGTSVDAGRVSINVGKGLAVNSTTNKLFVNTDDLDIQTISVAATEAILTLSDNVLSSTVRIAYDSATGYLTLYGKNNSIVTQAFIPGAEQALLGVEVVTNPSGLEPGTYFRYTFTTASGIVNSFVKVPEGSTTAAGNGISVNTSGGVDTVSAVADASKGVVVGPAGIGVVANENKGVTVDSNGVAVKLKSNGGILVDSNGLSVDTSIIPTVEGLEELTARVDTAETDITGLKTQQGQLEGDLQALDQKVDALELEASSLSISGSAVDPSTLDNSQGALYPATNLLS